MKCCLCSEKAVGFYCDQHRPSDAPFGFAAAELSDPDADTADLEPISLEAGPPLVGASETVQPGK